LTKNKRGSQWRRRVGKRTGITTYDGEVEREPASKGRGIFK